MTDIAVIVTCHEPYLKWLPQALESINRQQPAPAECVVVFDGCPALQLNDDRWRILEGDWRHLSSAHNAGLTLAASPWVIFWDADNVMADGYIAAMQQAIANASSATAIIYPDLLLCDDQLAPQSLRSMPEWDYWEMRAENCVDTASAWRRAGIDMLGDRPLRGAAFDDYALALDLTAAGWKAARLNGPPVMRRVHPEAMTQSLVSEGKVARVFWEARSLAIVTLLAGRTETFARWINFLRHAELPPKTALYVVNNSGDRIFAHRAFDQCQQVASDRAFTHLDFASVGRPYLAADDEAYLARERHQHVARLYSSVLRHVTEDTLMTLEDDIEPPLDAARKLGEEIGYSSQTRIGAVAAAYSAPHIEGEVCAGDGSDNDWGANLRWENVPDGPIDVGGVGGGCTVWANWALRGAPVQLRWERTFGWDAMASIEMRRKGFRTRLHGGVRCQHHIHGRVKAA